MSQSTLLQLPYLEAAQAQKHVTVNESLRILDGLVQLSVTSRAVSSPPGGPSDSVRYLVPAGATGAWAGKDGQIAIYQDGAWAYRQPRDGWLVWVEDEARLAKRAGGAWGDLTLGDFRADPVTAATDPTPGDDAADGHFLGRIWINTARKRAYVAVSVAPGAAFWLPMTNHEHVMPLIPGRSYAPHYAASLATQAMTENVFHAAPWYQPETCTFSHFGINVTTAAGDASCQVRMGIYADDGAGVPGNLIADLGNLTIANTTGNKFIASTQTLEPGWLWLILVVNRNGGAGALPVIQSVAAPNGWRMMGTGLLLTAAASVGSWGSFTMPATAPAFSQVAGTIPFWTVRIA